MIRSILVGLTSNENDVRVRSEQEYGRAKANDPRGLALGLVEFVRTEENSNMQNFSMILLRQLVLEKETWQSIGSESRAQIESLMIDSLFSNDSLARFTRVKITDVLSVMVGLEILEGRMGSGGSGNAIPDAFFQILKPNKNLDVIVAQLNFVSNISYALSSLTGEPELYDWLVKYFGETFNIIKSQEQMNPDTISELLISVISFMSSHSENKELLAGHDVENFCDFVIQNLPQAAKSRKVFQVFDLLSQTLEDLAAFFSGVIDKLTETLSNSIVSESDMSVVRSLTECLVSTVESNPIVFLKFPDLLRGYVVPTLHHVSTLDLYDDEEWAVFDEPIDTLHLFAGYAHDRVSTVLGGDPIFGIAVSFYTERFGNNPLEWHWKEQHSFLTMLRMMAESCSEQILGMSKTLVDIVLSLMTNFGNLRISNAATICLIQIAEDIPQIPAEYFGDILNAIKSVIGRDAGSVFEVMFVKTYAMSLLLMVSKAVSEHLESTHVREMLSIAEWALRESTQHRNPQYYGEALDVLTLLKEYDGSIDLTHLGEILMGPGIETVTAALESERPESKILLVSQTLEAVSAVVVNEKELSRSIPWLINLSVDLFRGSKFEIHDPNLTPLFKSWVVVLCKFPGLSSQVDGFYDQVMQVLDALCTHPLTGEILPGEQVQDVVYGEEGQRLKFVPEGIDARKFGIQLWVLILSKATADLQIPRDYIMNNVVVPNIAEYLDESGELREKASMLGFDLVRKYPELAGFYAEELFDAIGMEPRMDTVLLLLEDAKSLVENFDLGVETEWPVSLFNDFIILLNERRKKAALRIQREMSKNVNVSVDEVMSFFGMSYAAQQEVEAEIKVCGLLEDIGMALNNLKSKEIMDEWREFLFSNLAGFVLSRGGGSLDVYELQLLLVVIGDIIPNITPENARMVHHVCETGVAYLRENAEAVTSEFCQSLAYLLGVSAGVLVPLGMVDQSSLETYVGVVWSILTSSSFDEITKDNATAALLKILVSGFEILGREIAERHLLDLVGYNGGFAYYPIKKEKSEAKSSLQDITMLYQAISGNMENDRREFLASKIKFSEDFYKREFGI